MPPSAADGVAAADARAVTLQRLRAAVDRLPRSGREVVVLRHLQGLDVRATARALRIAEGTVKSRTARALAALRNELGDIGENGPWDI
jgi:RNA polymerase sigma factor (sigma-70 family)